MTVINNVLLVTIDSLRYDATDYLELASLSDDAIAFDRTYATGPGTSPSFPGLLTGTMPLSHGGLGPLVDDRPRLAENVQNIGLSTGGFQCNPFLSEHFNYDRGFDIFEDYQHPLMGVATKIFPRGIELNNPKLAAVDDLLHLTDAIKWTYRLVAGKPRPYVSAEVITDDASDWIKTVESPFFCWAQYMDVHHPCFPPREYRKNHGVQEVTQEDVSDWYSALVSDPDDLTAKNIDSLQRLYRAAIEYTANQVNCLFEQLRADGQFGETLVVLTSDHGELFGEHGQYGKPERMYDELLHVPLVVANGPDYLEDATADLVSLLDIPPLVHEALGLDVPDEYEGRTPGKDEPREYVMAEHEVGGDVIVGARSRDWLYEGDEIADEHRLFDFRNGGFQQVDRDHPDAAVVREAVLSRLEDLDVEGKYLQEDVDDDIEDRLTDLGYL